MDIKEIAVENIKAYAKNAKKHDEKQIKQIANSIKKFGFRQPVVIDSNNEIIIGHGRVEAARTLGMRTVPCVIASDLSEEEVKALRIVDNKVAESSFDDILLVKELESITGIDMSDFGFSNVEIPDFELEAMFDNFEKKEKKEERIQCPHCGEWFEK